VSSSASTPPSDDMLDPLRDAGEYPELRKPLIACDPVVKAFYRAEAKAFDLQRKYRWDAKVVEWFGTGAILLAIVILVLDGWDQNIAAPRLLTQHSLTEHLAWLELIAAFIAMLVVFVGSGRLHKEGWLIERNRAERCRMLKFRTLIDPKVWLGQGILPIDEFVRRKLQPIETAGLGELWEWIDGDPAPQWSSSTGVTLSREVLQQLLEYYQKTRLNFQRKYLDQTALRFERNERIRPSVLSFLFYAGIVCVFIHVLIDLIGGDQNAAAHASLLFLALAVGLPTIAAGLRTSFLARERARNASRYRAKSKALGEIDERLTELAAEHDAEAVFRELNFCEYVLDLDQREWLRLMIEAEWY
jgi:hypothetical protein